MLQHYITAHEQTLKDRFFRVFLASRGSSFRTYFIFTAAGIVSCGGRKTSPTSFWIDGIILNQLENNVLLKPVLWDVGSVALLR